MPKPIDLVGSRFGKLSVLERTESSKHGESRWICHCDCGNTVVFTYRQIKEGKKTDCGCERKSRYNTKHGASNTPLYQTWYSILRRCYDKKHYAYKYYGERGVYVCEEWHDFAKFREWVEATKPNEDYSIDRINNEDGYTPNNCRWASRKEQANNRRSNIEIKYNGECHNLTEWSNITGFNYKRVHNRMFKLGWSFEKAINTPVDTKKRNKVERKNHG